MSSSEKQNSHTAVHYLGSDGDTLENIDDLELEAVGYKREMPRQFSVITLGALSFTLTCSWLGFGSAIGTGLTEASAAGAFWTMPIAGIMTLILSAGMAELASAYPVAGAQYYWSYMVSSKEYKPFAAFINGWMSVFGWWTVAMSVANFVASMILSIVVMWHDEYVYKEWHQWLVMVAVIWFAVLINIFGHHLIPIYNKLMVYLAVLVLTSTTLTLFICGRHHHATAKWMFTDFSSETGWANKGLNFMLALVNSVFSFLASDAGAHLCEEIPNPSRNVPKVILMPLAFGLLVAMPFAASCLYAIYDVDDVLSTPTGLPLIEIYYQATQSSIGASILVAFFAFCFFACVVGNVTTSSRTLWAVSRDGALPFSKFWKRVNPRYQVPMNAILLSGTFITLYGLIFIGSTTAFSATVSANIIFLQTSCVLPQAILLWRGREKVLPDRYFSLGRWGKYINGVSVLWVALIDILACFPTVMPVTSASMNYVSVVVFGLISIILLIWFTSKRGKFHGPYIDEELLQERRLAALTSRVSAVPTHSTKI